MSCGSRASTQTGRWPSFLPKTQRRNLLDQTSHPVPERTQPRAEPGPLAVRVVYHCQCHPAALPSGLRRHDLDQGQRHHEGCLYSDPGHLHHCRRGHRRRGPADDQLWPHGSLHPGGPLLAEAHHHHLDDPELPGLHHGLHHPFLLRGPVDALVTHGHLRRHRRVDRGTSHVWPGFDKHISFGRSGL